MEHIKIQLSEHERVRYQQKIQEPRIIKRKVQNIRHVHVLQLHPFYNPDGVIHQFHFRRRP